jgi:hypothetical protein
MFQIYQGYELVCVKGVENWQVIILSGGKPITKTMFFADEDSALAEAKKIVDGFWGLRRSGPAQKPPPSSNSSNCGET